MRLGAFAGVVGLFQSLVLLRSAMERRTAYEGAVQISEETSKPMLVVGGPAAGDSRNTWIRVLKIPNHGCGDVCLDVDTTTCRICGDEVEVVEADVRLIPYPDSYFSVAYVSHVLEHLPTVDAAITAIQELYRVADEVVIVSPSKADITAWLNPDHHLWVEQKADGEIIVQQR